MQTTRIIARDDLGACPSCWWPVDGGVMVRCCLCHSPVRLEVSGIGPGGDVSFVCQAKTCLPDPSVQPDEEKRSRGEYQPVTQAVRLDGWPIVPPKLKPARQPFPPIMPHEQVVPNAFPDGGA